MPNKEDGKKAEGHLLPTAMSPPSPPKQFFILVCLLILSIPLTESNELEILLELKSSLQNSDSSVLKSWNPNTSPCNFTGISCNPKQSVTQISLPNMRLSGFLPLDLICRLPWLEKLDMGSNLLFGTISDALNNCTQLNHLDLSMNSFTGALPDFSSLVNLSFLNLNASGFSGVFPWKSLENLTSLYFLSLGDNSFEASKFPLEILKLDKLTWLYLSNCNIEGIIPPQIGNLMGLPNLELSGRIPAEISNYLNVFLTGLAVLVICLWSFLFLKKRRNDQVCSTKWKLTSFSKLDFTEENILDSINQDNVIGKGRSGNVYRADFGDGKYFAVKRIWKSDASSNFRGRNLSEFDTKVKTLCSIRHANVINLYRIITFDDSIFLVYEYLPNGSLWDRLHACNQNTVLDWQTRYDIAVGSAKGLEYLHYGCDRSVIHGDVQSRNILLDEFLKPRITNFGLSNLVLQAANASPRYSTAHAITGTRGYIAPEYEYEHEYAYRFKVNEKSDVYSFGVVLMELVTGKKPIHEPEFGENKDIVHWIRAQMNSWESVLGMVDTSIPGALQQDAVKVLRVAVLCTARLPALRPSMKKVVQMLEDAEPFKQVSITMMKTKRLKY